MTFDREPPDADDALMMVREMYGGRPRWVAYLTAEGYPITRGEWGSGKWLDMTVHGDQPGVRKFARALCDAPVRGAR